VGPVTVPATLYKPVVNARFLAFLNSIAPGCVFGISRGAYVVERATVKQVIETVNRVLDELRQIGWAETQLPDVYVGTSGPLLTKAAVKVPDVKGIVVDNLASPSYAITMKKWMDEAGGKKKELVARPFTFISEDHNRVLREFGLQLARYVADLVNGSPMMDAAGLSTTDLINLDEERVERLVKNFAVTGTVDEVLEHAVKLVKCGVDHFCFGHPISPDPIKDVKILANKIAPHLMEL